MFDKLFQAQQKAEEIKQRLNTMEVNSDIAGGQIKVTATANKEIKSLIITPEFLAKTNAEELEELLLVVINNVLEKAENINQAEMQAATQDMLGNLGGMFGQ